MLPGLAADPLIFLVDCFNESNFGGSAGNGHLEPGRRLTACQASAYLLLAYVPAADSASKLVQLFRKTKIA